MFPAQAILIKQKINISIISTWDEMLKMELKCSPRLATEFCLDLFPFTGAGLQILMLRSVFLANFRVLGLGCGLLKVAKMMKTL